MRKEGWRMIIRVELRSTSIWSLLWDRRLMIRRVCWLIERSRMLICIPNLTPRRISWTLDTLRLLDSEVTLLSTRILTPNCNPKRSIWNKSWWTWERGTVRMPRKLTNWTTKMKWSPRNQMTSLLRQELLNTIFQSSSQELTISTNWLIPKLLIWRAKKPSSSSARVKSFNWKIKWSVSKMN